MIFLSCLSGRGNTRVSVVWWKHFMLLSFSSLVKQNSFLSVQFDAFCIESSAIHRDRACCQKMTNCPKYAIALSISCPVIVFFWIGVKMGQDSLILLVYSSSDHRQLLCFLVYISWISFSTHPFFFELRSAAHIDTFELPCVKTVWIEVEGHCKCALMIVVERGETITSLLSPPRFFFKMVPGIETPQPWKGSHQWHQSINSCLLHCCHAIACCKFSCWPLKSQTSVY